MKVRFRNPPIKELVIGAYFNPPLIALRSEHIGLLWSRLRGEFPTVEQREPFGVVESHAPAATLGNEFLVMPRFWFMSRDEINLIQVQKNAFILNWRRRNSGYPHFSENLKPSFYRYYGIFEAFLKDDVDVRDPKIGLCELTYVNVIESSDCWRGPQDTTKVIPSFRIPSGGSAHGVTPDFNCIYLHEIERNLRLHVAIRTANTGAEGGSPCLVLEFRALGHPGGGAKSDADAWYERAHAAILDRFLSMTSEYVQRTYWITVEEAE